MAMITCPECGKSISDRALKCPACGYPVSKGNNSITSKNTSVNSKKVTIIVSCIIILVMLILAVILLFTPRSVFIREEIVSLTIGDEYELDYDIIPQRAIRIKPTISSSDENIVSVKAGKLIAINEGKCQIQITTWNGKSSQFKVEVISEQDKQKNYINLLSEYISDNADEKGENNTSVKQIYSMENNELFLLASSDNGVCMMFKKNNSYGSDLTMVLLKSGDLREAYLSDVSTFIFDDETMSITAKGKFIIAKYNYGDKVNINDVTSKNTPNDFEIGITDESQSRINEGVENAIKYFERFLNENSDYGKLSDYGFKLSE